MSALDERLDDYEVTAVPFGVGAPRLRLVWADLVGPDEAAVVDVTEKDAGVDDGPAAAIALLDAYRVSRVPACSLRAG